MTTSVTSRTTMEQRVARVFGLHGDRWMRHANALSVWTRFSVLPIIVLAVWSRAWIGWYSLIPVALALVWTAVDPLVFPVPRSTRNWASRGVFGERIWADRHSVDIPGQFRSPIPNIANALGGVGLVILTYGIIRVDPAATISALLVVSIAKLWYIDRMALLFAALRHRPEYAAWEY